MTWTSFHRRGEILRTVITTVDQRFHQDRDARLPMDLEGVAETFGDELTLLGALQLRWHTRLAGRIERELMHQPMDLERAVVTAWQATLDEMPGIRAVMDHYRDQPIDEGMARATSTSTGKERILLAVMAGRASSPETLANQTAAARVGAVIEERARATHRAVPSAEQQAANGSFVERLKASLVA